MSLTTSLPRGADWEGCFERVREEGWVLKEKSGSVREMAVEAEGGGETGGSGGEVECERAETEGEVMGDEVAVEADAESDEDDEGVQVEVSVNAERRVRRGGPVAGVSFRMAETSGMRCEEGARKERDEPRRRRVGWAQEGSHGTKVGWNRYGEQK